MPLEAVRPLFRRAQEGKYALGYFESWNLESLQGVIDAAEQARSPIIIGFNGDFLTRPNRRAAERLAWYAALGKAAAESASVPCGLIFNECPADDWVREAISAGFNLVMPSDPEADAQDFTQRVAQLARLAHERGVAIEAELGELPHAGAGPSHRGGFLTDPDAAARFVEATSIDLLAVSVGNVHIRLAGQDGLDLDLLARIHSRGSVPLALHGGAGISRAAIREAISLGVVKINYGTYLKQRYLLAVRSALLDDSRDPHRLGREGASAERKATMGDDNRDPHRLLGIGGEDDVMVAGRLAVRDAVLERIDWLGSTGKASGGEAP
jgi:ketose-bisphosphate aldolase